MIRIIVITKPDCVACSIVKKVILEAINNINCDITFSTITSNEALKENLKIDIHPTTIFYRKSKTIEEKAYGAYKEIARLEGSFPIDYLNKVIDKLKLECNE